MINNKDTAEKLAGYVKDLAANNHLSQELRNRFERIDRAIQREADRTQRKLESVAAMNRGDMSKIPDIELPLAFIQFDSALAWLSSIFATGIPMFRSVSNPQLEKVSSMMNGLIGKDQSRFGWTSEVCKTLGAALRYNLCAMEVSWTAKYGTVVGTNTTDGSATTSSTQQAIYSGNKFRHVNIYNTFYDPSCLPSELHEFGAFAGYIERYSYIRTKMFVKSLSDAFLVKHNLSKVYKSDCSSSSYYIPKVRLSDNSPNTLTGQQINWTQFFGLDSHNKHEGGGQFEVKTAYCRIIPAEFNMNVPSRGKPQVWKLITINDLLIYAEPIVAGHGYLPIIFAQPYDQEMGMQNKSFAENVIPLQHLGTSIIKGTIGAMRRNVADRMLYNPALVRPDDINSTAPDAKIPVKLNKYVQNFSQVVQPLDFRDSVTPQFTSNLGLVFELTNQVNGVNQAQQGNFVKGNKTLFEFDTVMNKADSRLQLMALNLENALFFPAKQIVKINYLLNATQELLYDPVTNTEIDIDPVELRRQSPDLRMADGLIPATKLGNTEVLMAAFSLMGQISDLQIEYKVGDMVISALRHQGFDNIDNYKRTPQEQQQYIQQQVAMQQGVQQANPGPGRPPENPQQ